MIVYLLALGSPTYPVEDSAWAEWTSTYDQSWQSDFGEPHLAFAPLFGHQYCQTWIDFRGLGDTYMSRRGIDYFENNRRAIYAQRAYAIANPHGWKDYGSDVWGVTASDGPADVEREYAGKLRMFRSYAGRGAGGPDGYDDGTLSPTAVIGSIPFAPEIVVPTIRELHRRYGEHIYSDYGFLDAFNPSFDFDVPLVHGRCIPGFGWVASDYLGIDQGPIVLMIENYRTGRVWNRMMQDDQIQTGLTRAGFTIQPSTGVGDPGVSGGISLRTIVPNPATVSATVRYSLPRAAFATLEVFDARGRRVLRPFALEQDAGEHAETVATDGLSPGLYWMRLSTPYGVATTRFTRVR